MDRKITRRDFLNGVALTIGAAMLPPQLLRLLETDPEKLPDYYPPALTGLRGSHPGSFEVAHSLRDETSGVRPVRQLTRVKSTISLTSGCTPAISVRNFV